MKNRVNNSLFNKQLVNASFVESFRKLDPRVMIKNPIMFTVEVVTFVMLLLIVWIAVTGNTSQGSLGYNIVIFLVLLATVLFANFAEAIAEARGKAQADSLRKTREETPAKRIEKDGQSHIVSSSALRKGDVFECVAGDTIPADGEIIEGLASIDESAITGESAPVIREAGGDKSSVTGGTKVLSDRILVKVTVQPGESFLDKMIALVEGSSRQKTPNEIALTILLAGFTIVFVIVCATLKPFADYVGANITVAAFISLFVCLIPTTIGGLLSAIGIAGMDRALQANVITKSGKAVETAGDIDTLLLDKTGTITEPKMTVDDIVPLQPERYIADDIRMIMADYVCAMQDDNDTMAALRRYFTGQSMQTAIDAVPFRSAKKYGGVSFHEDETYLLGAPEILLANCPEKEQYLPLAEEWSAKGCRVLLLALYDGKLSDEALDAEMMPLALILLSNKIRPEAPQTFSYFAQQGVRTKVISGDNPLTVSEVARRAGIPNAEKFVDARTLKTDAELARAAEDMTVFGRVTPDQKKKLVAAMKRAGHTVAMTGDGVNDVLALREADCSIAMASGSGVACQASHIVLLDSQFSALPSVVAEGRRVINNIERSASLYLVKNIFTFVLSLITLFFTLPYPYTPAQLSLVNALTIGIPSFILAMEPNENRISGRFLPNVIYRALPAALSDLILVVGVMLFYLAFHIKEDMLSTLCTGIMGIVGLLMVHQTSLPMNKLRKAMLVGLCIAFVVCYFFLPELFTLSALDKPSLLILVVLGLLAFSVMFVCRRGLRKVKARLNKGIFPRRKKR